jgi:hypothetical protein
LTAAIGDAATRKELVNAMMKKHEGYIHNQPMPKPVVPLLYRSIKRDRPTSDDTKVRAKLRRPSKATKNSKRKNRRANK